MKWKKEEDNDAYYNVSDTSDDENEDEDEDDQLIESDKDESNVPLVEEEVKRSWSRCTLKAYNWGMKAGAIDTEDENVSGLQLFAADFKPIEETLFDTMDKLS